jgi:hypothetical protein
MPDESKKTIHKQGSIVSKSGIYDVFHKGHQVLNRQVTCVKGKRFPPCRECREQVTFRLVKAALHVEEDEYLKTGAKSAFEEALSGLSKKGSR